VPLLLASAFTLINALKPLHVDDATFYANASHIARKPLDPYGFTLMVRDRPAAALHALAPPVLPYWWAAGIRLFGEHPFAWKLWLLPFAFLFVAALWTLLRRFAPGLELPLTVMTVFSPAVLPGFNLMMDVPALALSLVSLALFCRAADRDAALPAIAAGLIAGLAIQTKYTGLVAPAVLFAYAVVFRKVRLFILAALGTILIFAGWESLMVLRYGESHFLYQLFQGHNNDEPKSELLKALCPLLGAVAWPLTLLALTCLRSPRWLVIAAGLAGVLPYVVLASPAGATPDGPASAAVMARDASFAFSGVGVLLALAAVAWCLIRGPAVGPPVTDAPVHMAAWFLVCWLLLEFAAYVLISPFPAVRRLIGIVVAGTVVAGHLGAQASAMAPRRALWAGAVGASVLLGLGYFAVDYHEARAQQWAAAEAARRVRQASPNATAWFTGYWGFQFYAQRAGMKPVVPLCLPLDGSLAALPPSHLRAGDWLVIPSPNIPQQRLQMDVRKLELRAKVPVGDELPFATMMGYYSGKYALRQQRGPRLVVFLFRVRDDLIALPAQ
jgi:hypothetical protein